MQKVLMTRDKVVQAIASKKKPGGLRRTMNVPPGRLLSNILPDNFWRGHRCFIVGGGASLKSFDFSRLRGEKIIAVNRAYENIPFADIMCSMDSRYLDWIRKNQMALKRDGRESLKKFINFQGIKIWIYTHAFTIGNVYIVKGLGARGVSFSLRKGLFHGNNSGYGAINLAICLGANPIYLLGFDMKHAPGGRTHFHDGYLMKQSPYLLHRFIPHFHYLAKVLKKTNIKIINLNPHSALQCFPKRSIDDVLKTKKKCPFMVVSYFTKNTGYAREIQNLIRSAKQFNLPIDIEGVANLKDWQKNTHFKARVIRQMMDKHPDKSIIFVDADAVFKRDPMLFPIVDADIGICFRDYRRFPSAGRKEGKEFLSGTIYFANNEKTRNLVDQWIKLNSARSTVWEQKNLFHVIQSNIGKIKIFEFPATYCQIFDSMRNAGSPVVQHMQASRKFRGSL